MEQRVDMVSVAGLVEEQNCSGSWESAQAEKGAVAFVFQRLFVWLHFKDPVAFCGFSVVRLR